MANNFKFSETSSETNSIFKGKWSIGLTSGMGPTTQTGYYNGLTPPSGGYTIYLENPEGSPSVYTSLNDNELIELTNDIFNENFTSKQQCFDHYVDDENSVCLTKNIDSIVTENLILFLSSDQTLTSPKKYNKWLDLSGYENHCNLENQPLKNYHDLIFDGANQKGVVYHSEELNINSSFTVEAVVKEIGNSFDSSYWNVVSKYNQFILGPTGDNRMGFLVNSGSWYPSGYGSPLEWPNQDINFKKYHHYTGVFDMDNSKILLYIDGEKASEHSGDNHISSDSGVVQIAKRDAGGNYFEGGISEVRLYTKKLTDIEVKQNYHGGDITTENLDFSIDASKVVSYQPNQSKVHSMVGEGTGTLFNGVGFSNEKSGSFNFDGADDVIDLVNLPEYSKTCSTEAWIKINGNTGGGGDAGTILYHGGRYFQYDNQKRIRSYWNGGYYYLNNEIQYGKWHQVVQVWDGEQGELKIFVDGILKQTTPISKSLKSSNSIGQIGMQNTDPSGNYARIFNGEISIIRLYGKALTDSEVLKNYTSIHQRFS